MAELPIDVIGAFGRPMHQLLIIQVVDVAQRDKLTHIDVDFC
jgi:hypothetical protein